MAGQAHHRSADRTGQTNGRYAASRPHTPSQPPRVVPVSIDPDPPARPVEHALQKAVAVSVALVPDLLPQPIRTQGTYRLLTSLGLSQAEATGLIGYMVGLPTSKSQWTLTQINRLLFLRELYQGGWGNAERQPAD